ncbi:dicarboxylate/amino acid:cation symporter [Thermodesulfobacterium hydrogeniphilum]|uniref:dicarboxylate/amino acid:cation symporter n=1 Tax=Thermodesulfobacterium hydrogeniphilum TaxID=161156 RepID=UPI000689A1D3|nr:dicarboxylate/amino acid:cation symporter [Thermodesulfobacterium hydrogeniphilum]
MNFLKRIENQTLIAIFLAVLIGISFPSIILKFSVIGKVFLKLLKMVVTPLIFTSVFTSLLNLKSFKTLERVGIRTVIYYLSTTSLSVLLGLFIVNIIKPSAEIKIHEIPKLKTISLEDLVLGLFPENIVKSFASNEVIPIIFFAIVLGLAALKIGKKAQPLNSFFEALNESLLILTRGIIQLTPVGVFFLVGSLVAKEGFALLLSLWKYAGTVILGLAIHGLIILPFILYLFTQTNPWQYFLCIREAPLLAFSTASSSATLPVTIEVAEEKAKIRSEIAGFVLPLGSTINMDGTALYEAVAAMFIAYSYGLKLTFFQQFLIFITAVLASVGAAGIPSAGLVTLTLVFQSVGLPLEGLGLILAVDRFLDMLRTSINVWGDLVGAKIIDHWLNKERAHSIV